MVTQAEIEKIIIDVLYDGHFIQALVAALLKALPPPVPTKEAIIVEIPKIVGQPTFVSSLASAILAALPKT